MANSHNTSNNGDSASASESPNPPIPTIASGDKNPTTANLARKSGRLSASEAANAQKAFSKAPSNIIAIGLINGINGE